MKINKKSNKKNNSNIWHKISVFFGWNRYSYYLMSVFAATILLIIIVWWPLAEEYLSYFNPKIPMWRQIDWLLIGIFLAMSLLIMAGANIKTDAWIIVIGLCGGLVIEAWGTQTNLWVYYTNERPPLWIIPAWPIASLSIDRLVRILNKNLPPNKNFYKIIYWFVFPPFILLMIPFIFPTMDKSLTLMALLICILITISPTNFRLATLTFIAGSGLGYFLELWGTTRACWTYYTLQTPPVFAVFAHGLAAVAFWRTSLLFKEIVFPKTKELLSSVIKWA